MCVCRVCVAFPVDRRIMSVSLVNYLGLGRGSELLYKESQSDCGVGNKTAR